MLESLKYKVCVYVVYVDALCDYLGASACTQLGKDL